MSMNNTGGQFALEFAALLQQRLDPHRHVDGLGAEFLRRLVKRLLGFREIGPRTGAGDGLDAAHAGADGGFGKNLENADIAGALDVSAAAKLGREEILVAIVAHGNDTHFVAVLLAEQRHGPRLDGRFRLHQTGRDASVGGDLRIHVGFDGEQFIAGDRLRVRDVETQPFRRHQ